LLGKTVGHYEISGMLGSGGMGLVYRAHDVKLRRDVALKFLPPDLAQHRTAVERFEREAHAAAAVNHPNICTIYEVGEYEGSPFIAMELLEGETLKQRIARGPVPPDTLLDWAVQITEGMQAAHERGILHRDIKPANLFITGATSVYPGRMKILDFGLAKQSPLAAPAAAGRESQASTTLEVLTNPGMAAGTPFYMSPEQVRGEPLDARTDLFSFGVVLYEMATGRTPFHGATSGAILAAILRDEPEPLVHLNPVVVPEFERLVSKAMEKDRELRYQHASDLRVDLSRLRRGGSSGRVSAIPGVAGIGETATLSSLATAPPAAQNRRTKLWIAVLAVLAVSAAAGTYLAIRHRAAESFQTMTIERLTNVGEVEKVAISPDGKYLAYVARQQGNRSLWVRQVATHSDLRIRPPGPDICEGLTFSRDGNYIYYVLANNQTEAGQLYQIPTLGGEPRKILSGVDSVVSFSPDGTRFAFLRSTTSAGIALMVSDVDGSAVRQLAERSEPDSFDGLGISWSPDGKLVATSAYVNGRCYIWVVPAAGGQLKRVGKEGWMHIRQVAWLADSSGLILISMQSHSSPGQISRISYPAGDIRRITNDLNDYTDLSLTADSQTLIAVQHDVLSSIWTVPDARASRAIQITFGAGTQDGVFGLDLNPSGTVYASVAGGTRELWLLGRGSNPRQITNDADVGFFSTPSVCPDGHTIVYCAGRLGAALIWRIDTETRKPEVLVSTGTNGAPSCSPDGKWVYYNALGKFYSLWRVPLAGGNAEQLTHFPSTFPHVSPDGKWIAYILGEPNRSGFGFVPATGGEPVKTFDVSYMSPGGVSIIRWSPANDGIDYVDTRDGVSNIWRQPVQGGPPRQITDFISGFILNFAWSADGKALAVARGSIASDAVRIRNFTSQ
jgi:Tol biopolymer transport system component